MINSAYMSSAPPYLNEVYGLATGALTTLYFALKNGIDP